MRAVSAEKREKAEAKVQKHKIKTERLAEQHFKRVSNFAKEMLVNPEEIHIHKIKNEMLYELKPSAAQPLPLPSTVNKSGRASIARGLNLSTMSNNDFFN